MSRSKFVPLALSSRAMTIYVDVSGGFSMIYVPGYYLVYNQIVFRHKTLETVRQSE